MSSGAGPQTVAPGPKVDLSTSLAPFITMVGPDNDVLASTATLNGTTPLPPVGVLDAARASGNDTVTWQPASNVRQAIVAVPFDASGGKGVVVIGRSLRAIEQRETVTMLASGAAWVVTLIALLAACRFAVGLWGGGEPEPRPPWGRLLRSVPRRPANRVPTSSRQVYGRAVTLAEPPRAWTPGLTGRRSTLRSRRS